jgi:hypothetical protein
VIGGAILQNHLSSRLPTGLEDAAATNPALIYALIPTIRGLPGPLQAEVRALFAAGLVLVWRVMIGLCGIGLLTCLLMKEVPMCTALDEAWGLRDVDEKAGDREMPGEGKEDAPIDIGVSIA